MDSSQLNPAKVSDADLYWGAVKHLNARNTCTAESSSNDASSNNGLTPATSQSGSPSPNIPKVQDAPTSVNAGFLDILEAARKLFEPTGETSHNNPQNEGCQSIYTYTFIL